MTTTVNTDAPAYTVDGVLTDGEAWVALSTTVLTGDANSVTLESSTGANDWSQYMDLVLIINSQTDYTGSSAAYPIRAKFNDDAGANYMYQRFYGAGDGNGLAWYQKSQTTAIIAYSGSLGIGADVFGGCNVRFCDINSSKWKSILSQMANATDNASYQQVEFQGNSWSNAAAINKMQIYADTGGTWNFVADSRFDLFGVLPRMVS
jgi:hypothetical protein